MQNEVLQIKLTLSACRPGWFKQQAGRTKFG